MYDANAASAVVVLSDPPRATRLRRGLCASAPRAPRSAGKLTRMPSRRSTVPVPECPQCGARLRRMQRSAADRLLDLLRPSAQYRWRCQALQCQWHGKLASSRPNWRAHEAPVAMRKPLLDAARISAAPSLSKLTQPWLGRR